VFEILGDPHPVNLLIRYKPGTRTSQVVLLDHGLYITESEVLMIIIIILLYYWFENKKNVLPKV